jgi:cytochrome c-type biogenesis protein CcmH/NrfG
MPDAGFVAILIVVIGAVVAFVGWPLLRTGPRLPSGPDDVLATLTLRHRLGVEALRDVEADFRAGSLDDASYVQLRAEAEERVATTLADLDRARAVGMRRQPGTRTELRGSRRLALALGGGLALLLAAGVLLPGPVSLANGTVVDRQLAAAQAAERQRQAEIGRLRDQLVSHPNDPTTLVRLAMLYLDGGTASDHKTAARLLIIAIQLDPRNTDAYRLLITAYIAADDYSDAGAATDSLAKVAPSLPDVLFFRGLIALRGRGDGTEAVRWFDAFLAVAQDDPRAAMVRSLRAQAAGAVP